MQTGCFIFPPTLIHLSTKHFAFIIGRPKGDKRAQVEKTANLNKTFSPKITEKSP